VPTVIGACEPELMDRDTIDPRDDERALADLDRVTRRLCGLWALRRALLPRLATGMRLLDVGAGSGLAALDLQRRLRRRGGDLGVVCLDRRLRHLVAGRRLDGRRLASGRRRQGAAVSRRRLRLGCVQPFLSPLRQPRERRVTGEMRASPAAAWRSRTCGTRRGVPRCCGFFFPFFGVGAVARHDGLVSLARAWTLERVR
jgi:hypothetical protein